MKNINRIKTIGSAGFSLIEMLVVIAVIGVIAAIAIPNIGKKAPDKPIADGTAPALTDLKPGGSIAVTSTEADKQILAKSFVTAWNTAVDQKIVDAQKHTGVTEKLVAVMDNPTKFGINTKIASDLDHNSAAIFKLVENDVATGKLSLTKLEKGTSASTNSTTGADKSKVGT